MHIIIDKADPLTSEGETPNTTIEIVKELERCKTLKDAEIHYEQQAELIENALFGSLPQGVYDRLIVKLMKRKTSLYRGITR